MNCIPCIFLERTGGGHFARDNWRQPEGNLNDSDSLNEDLIYIPARRARHTPEQIKAEEVADNTSTKYYNSREYSIILTKLDILLNVYGSSSSSEQVEGIQVLWEIQVIIYEATWTTMRCS